MFRGHKWRLVSFLVSSLHGGLLQHALYIQMHVQQAAELVRLMLPQVSDSSIAFMPRTEVIDARSGGHLG